MLSVAEGSGSKPDDPEGRRLGGYLMFCTMASLAVSSALWMTATSANPIGIQLVREYGIQIGFGKWLVASSCAGADRNPGFALDHRPPVPATAWARRRKLRSPRAKPLRHWDRSRATSESPQLHSR